MKVDASQKSGLGPNISSAAHKLHGPGHVPFSSLISHVCKRRIMPPPSGDVGEILWEYVCEGLSPDQAEEVLQNCDGL